MKRGRAGERGGRRTKPRISADPTQRDGSDRRGLLFFYLNPRRTVLEPPGRLMIVKMVKRSGRENKRSKVGRIVLGEGSASSRR